MNKEEFNMLTVDNQVNYINSRLDEDLTLRYVIERELKLPRSTIRNRFTRNNYVFNKRANRYIKSNQVNNIKFKNNSHKINTEESGNKNITDSNINAKAHVHEQTQCSNINITKSNTVVETINPSDKIKFNVSQKVNKSQNIKDSNTNITEKSVKIPFIENKRDNNKGSIVMDHVKDKNNIDVKLDNLRKKIKDNIDRTKNTCDTTELEDKESTKTSNKNNRDETQKYKDGNINITESNIKTTSLETTEIKDLRELLKHKDNILKLLDNKSLNKRNNIDISELSGDLKVKTIKIYDSVLKKFNKFIKDHKEFKQQDIISLALKEFLDRHS